METRQGATYLKISRREQGASNRYERLGAGKGGSPRRGMGVVGRKMRLNFVFVQCHMSRLDCVSEAKKVRLKYIKKNKTTQFTQSRTRASDVR